MTRELAARADALLSRLEWSGRDENGSAFCTECGFPSANAIGAREHSPDCELGSLRDALNAVEPLALDAMRKAPES